MDLARFWKRCAWIVPDISAVRAVFEVGFTAGVIGKVKTGRSKSGGIKRTAIDERKKTLSDDLYAKIIAHVNGKSWWHVPPRDVTAYKKRGRFLASSYREAEFWGRPLDEPQRVNVKCPLVGDEVTIEQILFGRRLSEENIGIEKRFQLDAKMKKAAQAHGFDAIPLLTTKGFSEFKSKGLIPRSLELKVFN